MEKICLMTERRFFAFNMVEQDLDFLQSQRAVVIAMLEFAVVSLQCFVLYFQGIEPTIQLARRGLTDLVQFLTKFVELLTGTLDLDIEMVCGMIIHHGFWVYPTCTLPSSPKLRKPFRDPP